MTPIEEIREAVRVLRETAGAVPPGPWEADGSEIYAGPARTWVAETLTYTDKQTAANSAYIALMDPPVALALADLLADIAAYHEAEATDPAYAPPLPLALARAVLKREVGS